MKFEQPIFRGNLSHIGPETEGLYCFYCTTLILPKIAKKGHYILEITDWLNTIEQDISPKSATMICAK